eukprot:TRINITY_DN13358_c0_g1_i1.p2 TRINITY_DN13358_c0_g1~~TRINITY_DN13358_c0_g1_i1.p2  ORF type:complete len:262 (-),score=28.42 TRINITY_DN13358_c0_g1_i1:1608-2393(-)
MSIAGQVCVVTGGGSGIGKAICEKFAQLGAKAVVVVDVNLDTCQQVAKSLPNNVGHAMRADCSREGDIHQVVTKTEMTIGPIGIFVANAGILAMGGVDTTNDTWERIMGVNYYQHVYVARHVIPRMVRRGGGTLIITASAAGLLTQIGSLPYAVTKKASVSIAEWISITHGGDGIKVHCLCPQAVNTGMTTGGPGVAGVDGMLEPETVARDVVAAMEKGTFLVLPHPSVKEYMQRRAANHDRWLAGMRRLQERFSAMVPKL